MVLSPAVAAAIKPPAGSIKSFVALGGARGGKQHGSPQQGVYPFFFRAVTFRNVPGDAPDEYFPEKIMKQVIFDV